MTQGLRHRSKATSILITFATILGWLVLGFLFGYFVAFKDLKSVPADAQAGLAEFLRMVYSLVMAGVFAVAGPVLRWLFRN